MISLVNNTIDNTDIDSLIKWLKTYPRLTQGKLTKKFESAFSKLIGRRYSVFVNSGSSANLLLLSALSQIKYLKNNKIVLPAVSWSTDLSPVLQLGMIPILCDANLNNLSVDLAQLENIFKKQSPAALLLVSVLGLVPDMNKITSLCNKYNVMLIEDSCESMGSKYNNKYLGTFGIASTFSTFFGHHISTIEGGLISTDDEYLYNVLLSIRSHGWDRNMSAKYKNLLQHTWKSSKFDSLYTFYYEGYNVRATDLQAKIGLGQLYKLNFWGKIRNTNYKLYKKLLDSSYWMPTDLPNSYISNFAYPIISKYKQKIILDLQKHGVETRPLICGSLGEQPVWIKRFGKLTLNAASYINKYGFYIPNHPKLTTDTIQYICNILNKHTHE